MAPLPPLGQIPDEIEVLTDQFARTGNRALAWHIYHLCREIDRVVPARVMAVIDDFAAGISAVARAAMDSSPGDVPIKFEPADLGRLWRADGGSDPVGALQDETRDLKVFLRLLNLVDRGDSVASAIAFEAKKKIKGLGKDRLWQIWGAFQKSSSSPGRRTVR